LLIDDFIVGVDIIIIKSLNIWTLLYVFNFINIDSSISRFLFGYVLIVPIEFHIISLSIPDIMRHVSLSRP